MFGQKPMGFGAGFGGGTSSTFGSSTPFGQNNNSFGNKPAGAAGFGTPAFGSTTPAAGGLFGANNNTSTGGLFGQTNASTFGNQSTGFNFGNTPSTSSGGAGGLFGQTQTQSAGGLFSTPQSTTSAFGAKTPGFGGFGTSTAPAGGLFGQQNQANTGGMLFGQAGAAGFANNANGTTVKFNPPSGQDTMMKNGVSASINTRHQCITAMKEYDNKCLEELRLEDYQANRKGKQQGTGGAGGGLFGSTPATSSTGFSFGQQPQQQQQQQQQASTGFAGFGTNTSTASTGLFGQTNPQASGGMFGQNKPLFGGASTTTTASTTGFGFGNTNQAAGLFGQNQQNKPLFGTATTQSSLFGANTSTAPATSFNFGNTGGFGTQAPSAGLFGSKPAGFGAATTSAPGFFGQGGNLFAKPTTTSSFGFGGTSTGTAGFGGFGGFGSTANTGGAGLFGNKPGGFGAAAASTLGGPTNSFNFGQTGQTGAGLFGANNMNKPSTFGFNFNSGQTTASTGFGGVVTGSGFSLGGNTSTLGTTTNPSASNNQLQQQLLALTSSPFGDSPLFWNLKQNSEKREEVLKPTNPAAQKAALSSSSQYKVSPRPTAKIKPKSLHSLMNGSKSQLFDGLEDEDFSFGNDTFMPRRSVKKLTLKKVNGDSSNMSRASSQTDEQPDLQSFSQDTPRPKPITRTLQADLDRAAQSPDTEPILRTKSITEPTRHSPMKDTTSLDDTIAALNSKNKVLSGNSHSDMNKSHSEQDPNVSIEPQAQMEDFEPHPTGIILTRPGYYTSPSLDSLVELIDENGDCFVDDFTIGRENYGSLFFPGSTNVANLNLDEIVHFRRKEVIVYPDDDKKPPLEEGLNKIAEVTLDCVWPSDKSTRSPIKDSSRLRTMGYQTKIEEITAKIGAKFIDYRPETGSWVFQVKHFSKYGLVDDSDEEEVSESEKKKLKLANEQQLQIQKLKIQTEGQMKGKEVKGQGDIDFQLQGLTGKPVSPPKEGYEAHYAQSEGMDDFDEDMPDITMEKFPRDMEDSDDDMKGMTDTPSSHRLASSMGVSAHSMQVMKASFFGDDDYQDDFKGKLSGFTSGQTFLKQQDKTMPSLFSPALKSKYVSPLRVTQSPVPQEMQKQPPGLFSQKIIAPEARRPPQNFGHPPLAEHMLLTSGLSQKDTPRKIVGSRVKRDIPPVSDSLMYKKQELIVDAGCLMGRSFRVGWGPGWTLVHSGQPSNYKEKEAPRQTPFSLLPGIQGGKPVRAGSKAWTVTCEKMDVADYLTGNDKTVISTHEEMLDVQLENSQRDTDGGCPLFVPSPGVDSLHQYAQLGEKLLEENSGHPDESSVDHIRMVWNLCVALWGNLPEFRYSDTDEYAVSQARREAFSKWLSETAQPKIKEEVQESKFKSQGHLIAILSYLSGRQITDACTLAQKSGDHRLALSLAQAVGSNVARQMLAQQLEEWAELGANHFIDQVRLKIYSLLSGQLVWSSSTAVNTCDNMDWKRALALHLWYHCKPNASISEALSQYEDAFKSRTSFGKYSNSPLPPYLEDDDSYEEEEEAMDERDDHVVRDTCYHLLKLYCQKGHRLERILNPTTSTANQLDYRLSWHLYQVLQSMSYHHVSPYHAACLHTSFAAQLEALHLWHWAVFALLHIEDALRRETAVRSVLERHVTLSKSPKYLHKEEFVRERLRVPHAWIHHAKAIKARSENKYHDEAWHLLKAAQWNEGHKVILAHIAADAIINENFAYLRRYLEELSPPEISSSVLDWSTGGKVFLDYINLCQRLENLKQGTPSAYDLERLQPAVTSLCNRVGSLECRSSKERLCQSEMAKKSANLLGTLLTFQSAGSATGRPPTRLVASHISGLPMPEDYALQELRELTRSHLLEMTMGT
ncbi:nuclear pore complex protein Nup98-Nup96-like isoform X2 [Haliotis rufescens]|uniref:nuclear pore complex protein Nup98-Nup96-like isoform X2 n=1 Tax=Haliotis rufescens TaxID=6454 RepID=UPI00201F6043|nr:nuclear pore complex protein Nup98-Nup96-like isoform X2 [Haliotis rufescens]